MFVGGLLLLLLFVGRGGLCIYRSSFLPCLSIAEVGNSSCHTMEFKRSYLHMNIPEVVVMKTIVES